MRNLVGRRLLFAAIVWVVVGPLSAVRGQETALDRLQQFLAAGRSERPLLAEQPFAKEPLSLQEAESAADLLWNDRQAEIRRERAAEMEAREIVLDEWRMPFTYRVFSDAPPSGRSLFISMHGGGEMPAEVNDRQWENQKRLYELDEGVYLVPRAPTNSWNMWHQAHIDKFFARLIENLIVFEAVDPNRVYLLGYSAGGDGVFQLAPRMADRFAAAAMMAGHPNETSPLGLRNLPFTLHMGENDKAFGRNAIAVQWRDALAELQQKDPEGYPHHVEIHAGKGHWMDREDRAAIPWLAQQVRRPFPQRVVWKQDDVTHDRFYWLGVSPGGAQAGSLVIASASGNTIRIEQADGVERLQLWLSDALVDLEKPIRVEWQGRPVWEGRAQRTIAAMERSLNVRDRTACASALVEVRLIPSLYPE